MGKDPAGSDGVIAIITIMMLELKAPHGADFSVLLPLWPVFMSYVLSFIYVGIYRNKPNTRVTHLPRAHVNPHYEHVQPTTT
jgi:uncharacterized membrane protein